MGEYSIQIRINVLHMNTIKCIINILCWSILILYIGNIKSVVRKLSLYRLLNRVLY